MKGTASAPPSTVNRIVPGPARCVKSECLPRLLANDFLDPHGHSRIATHDDENMRRGAQQIEWIVVRQAGSRDLAPREGSHDPIDLCALVWSELILSQHNSPR